MDKVIGLVTAWSSELWIEPALKQAIEYCDEVIVSVACYNNKLMRFKDDTYSICKRYSEKITLLDLPNGTNRTTMLNKMLISSKLFDIGNWVWLLDVDEFYGVDAYNKIKCVIDSGNYNFIKVEEKFFLIDMRHYLTGSHMRLMRIGSPNDKYKPTNNWTGKKDPLYTLPRKNGMFHYSMLTNTEIHKTRWSTFPSRKRWLDEIYYKYDLENEDYWINENFKRFGIKSPWFSAGFLPNSEGKLFKYFGDHSKFVKEFGLIKIEDFRKYYNNYKGGYK